MRKSLLVGLGFLAGVFVILTFLVTSPDFGQSRYEHEVQNSIFASVLPILSVGPGPPNPRSICTTISGALRWKNRQLYEAALSQDLALRRGSFVVAMENRWAEKSRGEKVSIGLFGANDDELKAAQKAVSEANAVVKDGHRLADFMIACGVWNVG
jgi:hypothetical protein